jgi:hypothetical protein
MPLEQVNLREEYDRARLRFDNQLASALIAQTDLSHAEIAQQFVISQKVVRRVIKQFHIDARKRGPKPKPQMLNGEGDGAVEPPPAAHESLGG